VRMWGNRVKAGNWSLAMHHIFGLFSTDHTVRTARTI